MRFGHEEVGDLVVVTARAAQPANIPGVDDLHFAGGKESDDPLVRHAVSLEARPIYIVHNATTQNPFTMVDAAAVRPAAGHAVPTVHDLGFSYWHETSRDRRLLVHKDATRDRFRQKAGEVAVDRGDHGAPADGAVVSCQSFDNPHEIRQAQLRTTEIPCEPKREETELAQRLDKPGRQSALAFDFVP